jgi:hypothetical protein
MTPMSKTGRPSPNQVAAEQGRQMRIGILASLAGYLAANRRPPTRVELAGLCGISTRALHKHIQILIDRDLVEDAGGSRGLFVKE